MTARTVTARATVPLNGWPVGYANRAGAFRNPAPARKDTPPPEPRPHIAAIEGHWFTDDGWTDGGAEVTE
jgi:hypothetical protein